MTESRPIEILLKEAFQMADTLNAPLSERLSCYLKRSRELVPQLEEAYDRLVKRIAIGNADDNSPQVGDVVPEFVLTNSDGNLVSMESFLDKGPLVISFNRGPWCDYCGLELRALSRIYPDLRTSGADIVAIVPATAEFAEKLQVDRDLPFQVLSDLDFSYALSLGLVFWIGDEVQELYKGFGIDLPRFHNQDGWLLPIPATFVVGDDQRLRAKFVDPEFRRRMAIDEILAALGSCETV